MTSYHIFVLMRCHHWTSVWAIWAVVGEDNKICDVTLLTLWCHQVVAQHFKRYPLLSLNYLLNKLPTRQGIHRNTQCCKNFRHYDDDSHALFKSIGNRLIMEFLLILLIPHIFLDGHSHLLCTSICYKSNQKNQKITNGFGGMFRF